jgi:DNA-binding MarR family transcriptional regulator
LRVTQFTLLQALVRARNISQGNLAEVLGLDSTTLTRTLALLRRKGWIQAKQGGEDRWQARLTLTAEGKGEYRRARPYWLSAQARLRRALGEVHWKRVMAATIRTAALALER